MSTSKSKKTVYKRNKKLGKIYHPDSGLVIKSAKEKIVIGRIDGDEFVPLDETALELCEKWNFKYDESLVEETDASDSEEEELPVEKKGKSAGKAKSKPDSVKGDDSDSEEEELPAEKKGKSAGKAKGKPDSVKGVDSEEETPAEKKGRSQTKDEVAQLPAGFTEILDRHNKELQDFVNSIKPVESGDNKRVNELEAEVAELKKELASTKKKIKGVLAAMQTSM